MSTIPPFLVEVKVCPSPIATLVLLLSSTCALKPKPLATPATDTGIMLAVIVLVTPSPCLAVIVISPSEEVKADFLPSVSLSTVIVLLLAFLPSTTKIFALPPIVPLTPIVSSLALLLSLVAIVIPLVPSSAAPLMLISF